MVKNPREWSTKRWVISLLLVIVAALWVRGSIEGQEEQRRQDAYRNHQTAIFRDTLAKLRYKKCTMEEWEAEMKDRGWTVDHHFLEPNVVKVTGTHPGENVGSNRVSPHCEATYDLRTGQVLSEDSDALFFDPD